MTVRRATAAVSIVLLAMLAVAVAEASLLVLLLVFSSILRLAVFVQLGPQILSLWAPLLAEPNVAIHHAGAMGSIVFTLACGAGAAAWRYRRWSPV